MKKMVYSPMWVLTVAMLIGAACDTMHGSAQDPKGGPTDREHWLATQAVLWAGRGVASGVVGSVKGLGSGAGSLLKTAWHYGKPTNFIPSKATIWSYVPTWEEAGSLGLGTVAVAGAAAAAGAAGFTAYDWYYQWTHEKELYQKELHKKTDISANDIHNVCERWEIVYQIPVVKIAPLLSELVRLQQLQKSMTAKVNTVLEKLITKGKAKDFDPLEELRKIQ